MRRSEIIRETMLGGPGLDSYAFQAALYCRGCARDIVRKVAGKLKLTSTDDCLFQDSETLPQPGFFSESDSEEFCDSCGEYLYGGDADKVQS